MKTPKKQKPTKSTKPKNSVPSKQVGAIPNPVIPPGSALDATAKKIASSSKKADTKFKDAKDALANKPSKKAKGSEKQSPRGKGKNDSAILRSILGAVERLYKKHARTIIDLREKTDDKKITVSFSCEVDCKETAPLVDTKLRISNKPITDHVKTRLSNSDQGDFVFLSDMDKDDDVRMKVSVTNN